MTARAPNRNRNRNRDRDGGEQAEQSTQNNQNNQDKVRRQGSRAPAEQGKATRAAEPPTVTRTVKVVAGISQPQSLPRRNRRGGGAT